MDRKISILLLASLVLSAFSATVPRITTEEVDDAESKNIFLAEKLLVFAAEFKSFNESHWCVEATNYFIDTIDSLVTVDANPTLIADLRVRSEAEKQEAVKKINDLTANFNALNTQLFRIAEKLRLELFAELSEHFIQFQTITSSIETQYVDFQSYLNFVISDLELAVLLAINGLSHPNIPDVHTHLQQSKDAAINGNEFVVQAEALYTNAKNAAFSAIDVIVSQTKFKTEQKREVRFVLRGQAAPEDVTSAQSGILNWIEHMISINTKFSRLNNALSLQVADSFHEIFASMRELLVDEATVSSIETDNRIDGQLLKLTISTVGSAMQTTTTTLDTINYILNHLDGDSRGKLQTLRDTLSSNINTVNSDYNTVFTTIDTNLPLTLENIRVAIAGLSGDPVIRIYLAIQEIENTFSTNRIDIESEKPLYDDNITAFLPVLDQIIKDLCSGLFC
ncbi:Hypothetical predicted protein [Cloeon dipterum]|uniref:Uncharacterized protein n=1 Tax=Cloeon dipterum TaxID=197152 RepID=A0A8S1CT46_9INSE|nr:Hypothetical predicted protein [Cloeon dipterum]